MVFESFKHLVIAGFARNFDIKKYVHFRPQVFLCVMLPSDT